MYRIVEIKEGNSTEPVQYVGVYTLRWKDVNTQVDAPEVGFVEVEEDEISEIVVNHCEDFMDQKNIELLIRNIIKGFRK